MLDRNRLVTATAALLGLVALGATLDRPAALTSTAPLPEATSQDGGSGVERGSSIVTLWANDQLAAAWPSATVTNGRLDYRGTDLVYNTFAANKLSFGYLGDSLVTVVQRKGPLKVPVVRDRTNRSPAIEPDVFHTLAIDRKRIVYQTGIGKLEELREVSSQWRRTPVAKLVHIEPKEGDVIIVRHQPNGARGGERNLKLQVIEHRVGRSLTLRVGSL